MTITLIIFGGIGVFLLGMALMNDGLKTLAGNSLKQILSKFTGGIFTSIISGATVTAIIQSSSATIFMMIGFVSAGFLSFSQSVGVVIGANLGSTSIGWIVSAIGFKVSMNTLAMPLIGIGAFMKFFSKVKYSSHGIAIAGFGLLFLGIDILQNGMSSFTESFYIGSMGQHTFTQTLILILIGIIMTVLMQSSGAAMVVTLAALSADALMFEQAAALVIGQNVGTTVKAFVITIGGTAPAKRTAMAHISFNLFTGLISLLFLGIIIKLVMWLGNLLHVHDEAVLLALFSTVIYLVGAAIVVPLLPYFTKLIVKLIPDRNGELTKHLDPSVAMVAPVALEAVRRTLIKVMRVITDVGLKVYTTKTFSIEMTKQLDLAHAALGETRQFLSRISNEAATTTQREYRQQVSLIHAIDHFARLLATLRESESIQFLNNNQRTQGLSVRMEALFLDLQRNLSKDRMDEVVKRLETNSLEIADIRRQDRKATFEMTPLQHTDVDIAIELVHTLHWIDRVAYHLWRGLYYINIGLHDDLSVYDELEDSVEDKDKNNDKGQDEEVR